jgi:uncharacterized protein
VKKNVIKLVALLLMVMLLTSTAIALTPTEAFYVNDYTGELSDETIQTLYNRAKNLADDTGVEVVVIVTDFVVGANVDAYATRIYNDWQIGTRKDSLGMLLLVAVEDGEVTIVIGQGAENVLSATRLGQIIDEFFFDGYDRGGIDMAVYATANEMIRVGNRELADLSTGVGQQAGNNPARGGNAPIGTPQANRDPFPWGIVVAIFIFIVIVLVISSSSRNRRRRRVGGMNMGGGFHANNRGRRNFNHSRGGSSFGQGVGMGLGMSVGNQLGNTIMGNNQRGAPAPRVSSPPMSSPLGRSGGGSSFGTSATRSFSSPTRSSSFGSSSSIGRSSGMGGGRSSGTSASRSFGGRR